MIIPERADLDAAVVGGPVEFLCFYGHTAEAGAAVGPWVLSQWWPAAFTVDGHGYHTAEQFMMAEKARLFGDERATAAVLACPTPAEAKRLGREVRGFDHDTWVEHRFDIVVRGNAAKFGQHDDLAAYLAGTGDAVLVEAAPDDRVWGVGLGADDPGVTDPARWRGENLLGFALMRVRASGA